MRVETLVKMANQIGTFYASNPDHEAAVAGVAGHISRFWDPRMRRELIAYVEGGGEAALSPIAGAAARRLKPVPESVSPS